MLSFKSRGCHKDELFSNIRPTLSEDVKGYVCHINNPCEGQNFDNEAFIQNVLDNISEGCGIGIKNDD